MPGKNQTAESLSKKATFATCIENFNNKIWLEIKNNPNNLKNLMQEFPKFGLEENLKSKRFNYEIQNQIILAAIFDPNNYLDKVKIIITSPLTTTSKGLFGNKEVVDLVNSNKMRNISLIYLETLKQSITDQNLKNKCQDLITDLEQTKF